MDTTPRCRSSLHEAQAHQHLLHGGFGGRSHSSEPPSSLEMIRACWAAPFQAAASSMRSSQPLRGWFDCNLSFYPKKKKKKESWLVAQVAQVI